MYLSHKEKRDMTLMRLYTRQGRTSYPSQVYTYTQLPYTHLYILYITIYMYVLYYMLGEYIYEEDEALPHWGHMSSNAISLTLSSSLTLV